MHGGDEKCIQIFVGNAGRKRQYGRIRHMRDKVANLQNAIFLEK
jgi:hypothetical protein